MSRIKTLIIGTLVVLLQLGLGGCSSIRLAYNNAPQLVWWWADGYVDFSREQTPQVKAGIERVLDWHRSTQLPDYLSLLVAGQSQVLEATTAAQVCRWQEQVREKLEPTLQRTLLLANEWLPGLGEAQFKHIEQRYAKGDEELRDNFLQADANERQAESFKRALERAELLYGRLGDAQKKVIREGVAASPFDPTLWLAERQRRQREVVATLRRLAAEKADSDKRLAALRMLAAHAERSVDVAYRSHQVKLADYNCALAAQIHNATTPAQRLKARENLKGWEEDLRSLIAAS